MRSVLVLLTVSVSLLASCATAPNKGPAPIHLVRKVMEHPMSGKKASEPMVDSASRITTKAGGTHMGTDFTSRKQPLPVFAVKEGVVLSNTAAKSSSGANTITVVNSDGSISRYLHIGSEVQPGAGLTIGESLGVVLLPGQPGYGATNTGPHLHYEQYLDQKLFDARKYMTTEEVIAQWTD